MIPLLQDAGFALRWMARSRAFTVTAVASLAVAIGIYTALFAIVDALLFRPLPGRGGERLVTLYTSGSDGEPWNTTSYADLMDLRASATFEDLAGHSAMMTAINLPDRSRLTLGEIVTGNYFQVIGVNAVVGRTLLPSDDRPGADRVAMVSHRYWTRELGSASDVVGRTIRMRGDPYTIVGVTPRGFTGMTPILSPDMWIPTAFAEDVEPGGIIDSVPSPGAKTRLDRRGYRWLFVTGRLKPGVTLEQARASAAAVMRGLEAAHPETNKGRHPSVLFARGVRLHPAADSGLLAGGAALMFAVGLVLLVACANVAGMLLARASARQREIAVRLAIGATRGRLVRQLVTESVILAIIGALSGTLVAWWLIRALTTVSPPIPIPLALNIQVDWRVLAFAIAASLVAGITAGIAPAMKASRTDLTSAMKGSATITRAGRLRWSLRDSLVAAQIAVTVVLVVVAGLLARSVGAMQRADVGFRTEGLAIVSTDTAMLRYDDARSRLFYDQAMARIAALPGVQSVARASRLPFSLNFNYDQLHIPEFSSPTERGFSIASAHVSRDYFTTLGVPILEGRAFTDADTPDTPRVAVVNETFAGRFWPNESAVGKRFHLRTPAGPAVEIVGVVANYRTQRVGEPPQPYVQFALSQRPTQFAVVVAHTSGSASALLADMRRELIALEPNLVLLDNQTMDAQIGVMTLPMRATAWLVTVVGAIGLMLAAIGLYGVVAYAVTRRTREIGTRMALGARRSQVLTLVVRQGAVVAGAGVAAGLVLAVLAVRAISGVFYGISAADPLAWAGAIVVLVAATALAHAVPALRASRIDPIQALRTE